MNSPLEVESSLIGRRFPSGSELSDIVLVLFDESDNNDARHMHVQLLTTHAMTSCADFSGNQAVAADTAQTRKAAIPN